MAAGLSEAPGIGRLLSENNFVVPNHQRDYSWTQDEIREFIEDITSALDAESTVYFIGLMVFLGTDPDVFEHVVGFHQAADAHSPRGKIKDNLF